MSRQLRCPLCTEPLGDAIFNKRREIYFCMPCKAYFHIDIITMKQLHEWMEQDMERKK